MKKSILFMLVLILIGISATNGFSVAEGRVPTCVKSTFYNNFPIAEHIHWTKVKKDIYAVQFLVSENKAVALINDKGVLMEADVLFFIDDVPAFVTEELKKDKDVHIVQFVKAIDINHDEFYLLTLKKGAEGFKIVFDQNWKVLQVYEQKNVKG